MKKFKNLVNPYFSFVSKGYLIVLDVLLLISSLEVVVNSQLMRLISQIGNNPGWNLILKILFTGIILAGAVYTANYFSERMKNRLIQKQMQELKRRYILTSITKDNKLDNNQINSTILNEFKLLETNFYQPFFNILFNAAMTVFSTIYMLSLNFLLGLIFITFSVLTVLPQMLMGKQIQASSRNWSVANEGFVSRLHELLTGLTTILSYNFPWFTGRVNQCLEKEENSYRLMNNKMVQVQWLAWLLSMVSYVGPVLLGILMIKTGSPITGADIVSMFLASDGVVGPFRMMLQYLSTLRTTTEVRNKINAKLKDFKENDFNFDSTQQDKTEPKKIILHEVNKSFSSNKEINIGNLTINKSDHLVITGRSGIGKSTMLKLISGLISPTNGKIKIENQKDKLINPTPDMFAIIPQSPFIIEGTILENLQFGTEASAELCLRALTQVNLTKELGSNPLNYFCESGGKNLSGGQQQRLAIARALVSKSNFILADEITAALDEKSSLAVWNALYKLPAGIVEIAHHYNEELLNKYHFVHYNFIEEDNKILLKKV
ncbi:ABC transporter ATP-binding protein [Lactobacillus sp. ESL0791]|uniref:ATP-binding cassette domain-containing protein n=1 Tax=Lactobacillus sp. ESL0791 TaxID=2983234 RepID=UPI0023F75C56|nr:ABC transporter ATP-binding protein [Lactobacillus sp. ESL0791]MDF7638977.1 ABC transporter ATP-binding protein [Lactobacillus sp. ESL0791]